MLKYLTWILIFFIVGCASRPSWPNERPINSPYRGYETK